MDKKGEYQEFIVKGLAITLVLLIIFLLFISKFRKNLEAKETEQICKTAVYSMVVSHFSAFDYFQQIKSLFKSKTDKLSDIKCPVQYETIEQKKNKAIEFELAEYMRRCWSTFGKGQFKLFETKTEEEKYCVICHNLDFKDKSKRISAKEFSDFLAQTTIPGEKEVTYQDFFTGYKTDPEILKKYENQIKTSNYDIDTSKRYVTMFTYGKKGYWDKWMRGAFGGSTGVATGLFLLPFSGGGSIVLIAGSIALGVSGGIIGYETGGDKTADWDAGIILMPYEAIELGKLDCTYLPAIQK